MCIDLQEGKKKKKRITNLVLQLLEKVQFDPQILIISI